MGSETLALREKVKIYELFASIFAKEPSVEFLRLLQQKDSQKLLGSHGIDCLSDIKHLSLEEQKESVAVEYAELFVLPGKSTSPYESIQRKEARRWGESTVQTDRIYRKFGFKLSDDFKDAPDHISAELSFLAKLSHLESDYMERGLDDSVRGVRRVKKYFLKNHLKMWFPGFKDDIIRKARLSYYKEFAKFLYNLLNEEWRSLKDAMEVVGDV